MSKARRIPGEGEIWVLIGGELLVFSLFFLVFAYYRALQPDLFFQSHLTLNRGIGLANTFVLLSSSLLVALGVRRVQQDRAGAVPLFRAALGCGAAFAILKAVEYAEKLRHGITPLTNDFYMYYFAFTAIHLVHVMVGCGGLIYMAAIARRRPHSPSRTMIVECGGIFWHMVDLLWIMLFALFYLAGGHG